MDYGILFPGKTSLFSFLIMFLSQNINILSPLGTVASLRQDSQILQFCPRNIETIYFISCREELPTSLEPERPAGWELQWRCCWWWSRPPTRIFSARSPTSPPSVPRSPGRRVRSSTCGASVVDNCWDKTFKYLLLISGLACTFCFVPGGSWWRRGRDGWGSGRPRRPPGASQSGAAGAQLWSNPQRRK